MANAEKNPGIVDKGLEGWQKFNKITLTVGISAGVVGVALGLPWLATLGFGSAALDAAQILALNEVKKKRNSPKAQTA